MKNVPIDQFRSLKCRNGAQNQNIREKLSKIGPFGNLTFGQRSTQKVKVNWSIVKVLTGQIRVVRVGSVRVNGQLGDVVLTRRHY